MANVTEELTSKFFKILMTLNSHVASGYPIGQHSSILYIHFGFSKRYNNISDPDIFEICND